MVKLENGASPAPLPMDESERLETLAKYDLLDTSPELAFDEITKIASFLCETPIALVSLVDENRQWFKSRVGLDAMETSRDLAFCAHAILNPGSIMEVCDTAKDERFNTNPLTALTSSVGIRFYCGAPLVTVDNKALGTLCVIDTKPKELSHLQKSMLQSLSKLVVDQIELRYRNKQLEQIRSLLEVTESQLRSHNKKLEERNADLEQRLKELEQNENNILNTPAAGVINLLRQLQTDIGPKHTLATDLEQVITLIGSHKLYEVDVQHAIQHGVPDIDSQTKGFLLTQLSNFTEDKQLNEYSKKKHVQAHPHSHARRASLESFGPILTNLDTWECDAFELQKATNSSALSCVGFHVISRHGLFTKLNLSVDKISNFLLSVEAGYLANPYHNHTHATDVLLAGNYLVRATGLEKYLTPKELLAILVACIVHDLGHPGLNNTFLVTTTNKLAILHNDRSVLENHHCVQAFKLLQNSENDFVEFLTQVDRQEIRKLVIELVLATDMANHVDIMNQFANRRKTAEGLDLGSKEDRLLAMKLVIKCADISNPARPPHIYHKWVDCVMEEFFQQGDREKQLSLPLSSFMDRETTHIPKCQIGFIQYICLPTFTALTEQFPSASQPLTYLQANMAEWKRELDGVAS